MQVPLVLTLSMRGSQRRIEGTVRGDGFGCIRISGGSQRRIEGIGLRTARGGLGVVREDLKGELKANTHHWGDSMVSTIQRGSQRRIEGTTPRLSSLKPQHGLEDLKGELKD